QAECGIRDRNVTGVQTCALPILYPMNTLKEPHSYCFCRSRLQRFLGRAFSGTSERALSGSSARVSAPHEVERMADDRGRVDAVDGMGLTHRGGLTEIADAEVAD